MHFRVCYLVLRTTLGTKRRPGLGKVVIVIHKQRGRKPENQINIQTQTTGNRMVKRKVSQSRVIKSRNLIKRVSYTESQIIWFTGNRLQNY